MIKTNIKKIGGLLGWAAGGMGLVYGIISLINGCSKYDKSGYDTEGYDQEGYNRNGYNRQGRDRQGYDAAGFNREGFNRQGFDVDGYDRQGYDIDGYNRSGRDKRGFDRNGFDVDGFDRFGRDAEGYRRNGFGIDGFNREGFDYHGFDRDRYNNSGFDRAGKCRQYYSDRIEQLRERLDKAYKQLKNGQYCYAIYDARVVMEDALRLIVQHAQGNSETDDGILINLKVCEHKHLLEDNAFLDRLHDVRRICNSNGHELDAESDMSHNTVHFVIMQIRDLLDSAEKTLVTIQGGFMEG